MERWLKVALAIGVAGAALSGCAAGAPPYASCGGEIGCAGGICIELLYTAVDGSEGGGTFCTDRCTTNDDCTALDAATDAVCVTLDRGAALRYICAPRCTDPSDCYAGLRCTATEDASLGSLCLP